MLRRRLSVLAAAMLAVALLAPAALAQSTVLTLTGGATTLTLDPATAEVLTANGVAVAPVHPAEGTDAGPAFPITGGEVDAATLAGTIDHAGGLAFTAGGRTLTVTDFRIDTTREVLTAKLFGVGPRVPLLRLDLSAVEVEAGDGTVVVSNVGASLTRAGAVALNLYFGVDLFSQGLAIGTATVDAEFATH